ncbi:MAG: PAS domain-containing protein, partial [Gemmataceae bacterium]|nr:PAS domain-containing protein [Gemmataceae bacterium]
MTPAPIETILREAIDRLARQEQRTDRLEAVVLGAVPNTLTQTPTARADPTVFRQPRKPPLTPPPAPRPCEPAGPVAAGVLASLDDVVWSVSPDGSLVFFLGGAVEAVYGLTAHELQDGKGRWLEAVPLGDRERLSLALARLTDTGTFRLEHGIGRAGGRWAVTRGTLVRDPDGRPLRVDGVTTDVTRRAAGGGAALAVLNAIGPATGEEFLRALTRHLCEALDGRAALVVEPHGLADARVTFGWADGRAGDPLTLLAPAGLLSDLLAGGRVFVPAAARDRYPGDPFVARLRAEAVAGEPLADEGGRLLGS